MLATRAPFPQYFGRDGRPLDAGYVYFGLPGQDAQTAPAPIFWDAAGLIPAAQPVRTLNGYTVRSGTAALVYSAGNYSITVRDEAGALVYSAPSSAEFSNESMLRDEIDALSSGAVGTAAQSPGYDLAWVCAGDWSGTTGTNDSAAAQAAIDALPEGSRVYTTRPLRLAGTLRINKPMTIACLSAGSPYNDAVRPGFYPDPGVVAFTLAARQANFAFGKWGVVGVHFENVYCAGRSSTPTSGFIGVDASVNGGDFHIRECSVERCVWKYHNVGVQFRGIAYLNTLVCNSGLYNDVAVKIERGTASETGGQTRFLGGYYGLNRDGLSLNRDTAGGDFGFHGVTVSENTRYGIDVDEEAILYTSPDCQFEANTVAGIYIEIGEPNPASGGIKTIGGKFLSNGADIWINKISSAFSGGGFYWPMSINHAELLSPTALEITVPAGHAGIDSPAFTIGPHVSGAAGGGQLLNSQISPLFLGSDLREMPFNALRLRLVNDPISYRGTGAADAYLASYVVAAGQTLYLDATRYSFSPTTGVRGNADLKLVDEGNVTRIDVFGNGTASPTWTNATGSSKVIRIRANDGGSGNPYYIGLMVRVA